MKLAIMQPYLFPYLPYFQLTKAVDKFVNYDDVSYIKKGWINRNTVLSHGSPLLFSIPIQDISSFRAINKTMINLRLYEAWKKKFFKTIHLNYNKAPFYNSGFAIVEKVLSLKSEYISEISFESIKVVCRYLEIKTELIESSDKYDNAHLKGKDRVLDICFRENADMYINPIGGESLYAKKDFEEHGVNLFFLKSKEVEYKQLSHEFVPNLSIIDAIMYNSVEKINEYLNEFDLI